MTAKEKAKELVDSYYWELENDYKAKQCALIAVDEILKLELNDGYDKEYWQQVKNEIEKL
jgi:hypothetical protein